MTRLLLLAILCLPLLTLSQDIKMQSSLPVRVNDLLKRMTLEVQFTIDSSMLSFWRADMTYGTEPGKIDIMTGPSSTDLQKITLTIL
jgi:hypothetical protein